MGGRHAMPAGAAAWHAPAAEFAVARLAERPYARPCQ